jgi:hypothetical protein
MTQQLQQLGEDDVPCEILKSVFIDTRIGAALRSQEGYGRVFIQTGLASMLQEIAPNYADIFSELVHELSPKSMFEYFGNFEDRGVLRKAASKLRLVIDFFIYQHGIY